MASSLGGAASTVAQAASCSKHQPYHDCRRCCRALSVCARRYKLSLLYRSGAQNLPPVSFKEFSDEKASTKVKKAAASSKGFGASAAKAASTAAAVTTELSGEQLEAILNCNAYGDDHLDGGLTSCRQEQQASIIGK